MKKQSLTFKYDKVAEALYLKVGSGKVAKTEETSPCFFVDYDKNGNIIGIEMLNVEKSANPDKLILNLKNLSKSCAK